METSAELIFVKFGAGKTGNTTTKTVLSRLPQVLTLCSGLLLLDTNDTLTIAAPWKCPSLDMNLIKGNESDIKLITGCSNGFHATRHDP